MVLTIGLRKKDNTAKFCMVTVNGVDQYHVDVPPQNPGVQLGASRCVCSSRRVGTQ